MLPWMSKSSRNNFSIHAPKGLARKHKGVYSLGPELEALLVKYASSSSKWLWTWSSPTSNYNTRGMYWFDFFAAILFKGHKKWINMLSHSYPLSRRFLIASSACRSYYSTNHKCLALVRRKTGKNAGTKRIKTDSVQSSSNMCKTYLLKIYSQHGNFLNAI